LSRLIKPDDKKVFQSATRFSTKPFRIKLASAEESDDAVESVPAAKAQLSPTAEADLSVSVRSIEAIREESELLIRETKERVKQIESEAKEEAERIVDEAGNRSDDIYRQARERGRADGKEEIRKEAERRHQASASMLANFVGQMKDREKELAESLTPRLAELAAELAKKIIHREVGRDSSIVTRQAEHAIAKILERGKLLIRVNPSDEESMREHKPTLVQMFDGIDKIEVFPDTGVERGGCVVETDLIKVDAQPRAQLEAARKTILGESEK